MRPMCMSAMLGFSSLRCHMVAVGILPARIDQRQKINTKSSYKPLSPNTGTDQTMSVSISRRKVAQLCFHVRYGSTSSGKTAIHTLSALQWRSSRERGR